MQEFTGILVHFQGECVSLFLHVAAFYDTALPLRSTDAAGWHFLIPLSIINVLVVGVALIVGSYFSLQGWALLLATTPAAIVALVVALAILSLDQKNQARQEGTAATDFYAG